MTKKSNIKTVLYIEDEPYYCTIYGGELERAGLQVTNVGNGEEALEVLKKQKFDLIIADLIMPLMSGISFLEKIKGKKHNVIVLTTLEGNEDREDCKALGVDHFLIKTETTPKKLLKEVELL